MKNETDSVKRDIFFLLAGCLILLVSASGECSDTNVDIRAEARAYISVYAAIKNRFESKSCIPLTADTTPFDLNNTHLPITQQLQTLDNLEALNCHQSAPALLVSAENGQYTLLSAYRDKAHAHRVGKQFLRDILTSAPVLIFFIGAFIYIFGVLLSPLRRSH